MARVLHVIPAIAARYGGPSSAILGTCRALEAAGFPALIATTDADGRGRLPVACERVQPYEGAQAIFFRRRFGEAYKWSGGLRAWLETHVSDFEVVHIHAVFSHASIAAGHACTLAAVPYIVRPLGTLDPWSVNRKRWRKRVLFRLGVDRLLAGAAAMHYTSADEQRLAESVVPRLPQGVVIPNGIDERMFASPRAMKDAADPYVLCLARIDEKKGIDLLIQAFQLVAGEDSLRGWRLVIAGDGDDSYVSKLKAAAERGGGARSRVSFKGWVAGEEKAALVRNASLFMLPSQQENFGISVAEAMAGCVPVVVTRGVNLAASIEGAGAGWVVDRNVPALTEMLRRAGRDVAELERRGRAGRALAERFRWTAVASDLIALYERTILQCAA